MLSEPSTRRHQHGMCKHTRRQLRLQTNIGLPSALLDCPALLCFAAVFCCSSMLCSAAQLYRSAVHFCCAALLLLGFAALPCSLADRNHAALRNMTNTRINQDGAPSWATHCNDTHCVVGSCMFGTGRIYFQLQKF